MPLLEATGQTFENAGADTSVSEGTNITASASANTKGSYTQLIASTTYTAGGLFVVLGGGSSGTHFLFDIAVGGAGSEQVIIPNLYCFLQNDSSLMYCYIPIMIPQGSRLSARGQSGGASSVRMNLVLVAGEGIAADAINYGANTSTTRGTQVNTSGSANTKGSWTELTSATTRRHKWCIVCVRAVSGTQYLFDIGIGGSGSEQVLVPNLNVQDANGGRAIMYGFPVDIPSGTRIAIRAAAASGSSNISVALAML